METTDSRFRIVRFGVFDVDLQTGEVYRSGMKVRLQDQPFQVLAMLLERSGELVTREEIKKKLWDSNTFVDFDLSLNAAVKKLRQALNDDAETPRYIETLPRRGYRFVASVTPVSPPAVDVGAGLVPAQGCPQGVPLRNRVLVVAGALVAIAAALIALNVAGLRDRIVSSAGARHGVALPKIESIAVLPLENLSRDPEQEYFADGMTDALITDLGKISALRVISRQSMMRYKGSKKPLPEIAKELNVDAIVEGTVQRSGDRVRITANLLHASTDRHLWAESYERDLRDVLVLQGDVARAIAEEVQVKLSPQQRVFLVPARAVNPQALEAYLKGNYFWESWRYGGSEKGIAYYRQAIAIDPSYAPPYAGLARAYYDLGHEGRLDPAAAYTEAKAAAVKAVQLDETLDEAHAQLGRIKLMYEWDWVGSDREIKRALELNPNSYSVALSHAEHLMFVGRFDEAAVEARRAYALNPVYSVGWIFLNTRHFDEGIANLRQVISMGVDTPLYHYLLAFHYAAQGACGQALVEAEKSNLRAACGWVYAVCGRPRLALKVVEELESQSKSQYVDPVFVASIYAGLGKKDKAFEWLEKGYKTRATWMVHLKSDIELDPIRSDPRFQDLVRRMSFPPENK